MTFVCLFVLFNLCFSIFLQLSKRIIKQPLTRYSKPKDPNLITKPSNCSYYSKINVPFYYYKYHPSLSNHLSLYIYYIISSLYHNSINLYVYCSFEFNFVATCVLAINYTCTRTGPRAGGLLIRTKLYLATFYIKNCTLS